jgi:HAD superfamily hydrolase (TIGR01509 family)
MKQPNLAAVLFDLDGTLVDSERESAEAMARALRDHGVAIDQADRDYIVGRSWVAIYESLRERYPLRWSRDELIAATAEHRDRVFAEVGITTLPGAQRILELTKHLPRAVVTGSSRREARSALRHLGVLDGFGAIIASEDVQRSKPAPDGYLAAIATLGVAAADCVVLEDSAPGIAAGKAAGCTVVAVAAGNFHGWDQSQADLVIATLDELDLPRLAQLVRGAT